MLRWAGSSWQPMSAPSASQDVMRLWASGPGDIWAVTGNGLLYRWTQSSWALQTRLASQRVVGMSGRGANDVWVGTERGRVYHWDGEDWTSEASVSSQALSELWLSADGAVFAGGRDGALPRRMASP